MVRLNTCSTPLEQTKKVPWRAARELEVTVKTSMQSAEIFWPLEMPRKQEVFPTLLWGQTGASHQRHWGTKQNRSRLDIEPGRKRGAQSQKSSPTLGLQLGEQDGCCWSGTEVRSWRSCVAGTGASGNSGGFGEQILMWDGGSGCTQTFMIFRTSQRVCPHPFPWTLIWQPDDQSRWMDLE